MKKVYTLNLAAFSLLVLLFSCQKDPVLPDGMKLPTLTINKISELPFSNTEWNHVFGGMAEVTYIKGSSSITDSLDLAKLSGYQKTLELGTYDVQLRTKSIATADTFIRFSAELKGLVVDKGQAISLTASTRDGLITIKKESIKDNSVPTFTPAQAGSKSYKMGLIDGYYFLYVTAGTSGQVSFYSKATNDLITKDLSIAAVNHYNLVVVTNGTSSIRVELQKFVYNEVQVSSSTLLTIKTPDWMDAGYEYTFVLSDENGQILNTARYELGTTIMKLESKVPYAKDRLSVFLLARHRASEMPPRISAYLNVRTGSAWAVEYKHMTDRPYSSPLMVTLKNVPAYENMTFSTDRWGMALRNSGDLNVFASFPFSFSEVSKVLFQVENQGKAFYNMFDIIKGTKSFEIDPALCTTPSSSKTITLPGPGDIWVYAKKDVLYNEIYLLGAKRFDTGSGTYFYPNEVFQEYSTRFQYVVNGVLYTDSYRGSEIPQTTNALNLNFAANGLSLATFKPSFTGMFDHYKAQFKNGSLVMEVFTPSAALSRNLAYPDLAPFIGFSEFDPSRLLITGIEAFKYDGFREDRLPYKDWHSDNLIGKSVYKSF